MVPFTLNGTQHLLSYKNGDGTAALDRINTDGSLASVWRDGWTDGWTSMVPFTLNGTQHLLSYKNGDGTAALDRIN
ncbi:hypothetical protein GCM10010193_12320 [Kitasatospora atroaurantiaca]